MFSVDWTSVLVATLVITGVAVVWYSPMVFGRFWVRAIGRLESDLPTDMSQMWGRMLVGFLLQYALFVALALAMIRLLEAKLHPMLAPALASIALLFAVGTSVVWERRPLAYFFIQGGFMVVAACGGGAIISYWPW